MTIPRSRRVYWRLYTHMRREHDFSARELAGVTLEGLEALHATFRCGDAA